MLKMLPLLLLCFIKPVDQKSADLANMQAKHVLQTGWYYIVEKSNGYSRQLDESNEQYNIDPKPIISPNHFNKIEMDLTKVKTVKYPDILVIHFDDIGTKAWSIATAKSIGNKLALIIDDKLVYVTQVNAQITFGISLLNRGDVYTKTDLERFEKIIKAEMKP